MGRVIVVSNRTPGAAPAAGGVAVALTEALDGAPGFWFGWSGNFCDKPDTKPQHVTRDNVNLVTLDLTRQEHEAYYAGYSNRVLWPVFHHRLDLAAINSSDYDGYAAVNAKFADALAPLIEPDDLVWVHDYHLIPVGEELRRRGIKCRIGFFLHIPFPGAEHLRAIPHHTDLIKALAAYDVIGLQTQRDVTTFYDYLMQSGLDAFAPHGVLRMGRKPPVIAAFPIGTDPDAFANLAESPAAKRMANRAASLTSGRKLIIGADRLDYTKGLPERLRAYERLLETRADVRRKVAMLQVAPPSRESIDEYKTIRDDLDRISGRLNGTFAEPDWVPLIYMRRTYGQASLAGLFREARVALVTPLRDGMNLVAHEFLASQSPEDPGVLVLSQFAGAAELLEDALQVNPHDVDDIANALYQALEMPHDERLDRWRRLMRVVNANTVTAWREAFLEALAADTAGPASAPARGARGGASPLQAAK